MEPSKLSLYEAAQAFIELNDFGTYIKVYEDTPGILSIQYFTEAMGARSATVNVTWRGEEEDLKTRYTGPVITSLFSVVDYLRKEHAEGNLVSSNAYA